MKKSLGLLMIVIAVIAMAFVSCDASTAPKADAVGEVVLDSSQSRGISVTVDNTVEVEDLYWYYKAEKKDNGLFNTGVTDGFVPVNTTAEGAADIGLQGANLGLFSYGNWEFTLCGVGTPITGNAIANAVILYSGSQTIDVNKDENFLNLTLVEGDGLTTEIMFDTTEGVWFSHSRIGGQSFSLTAVDYVNGVEQARITSSDESIETVNGMNRVSFKNMSYPALSGGIVPGQHVMRFTLTQSNVDSNIATVATYELTYTVKKGYTHTIKGDLTSAEVQGEVAVGTYVKSVPATTATLVLPVTVNEAGSSKTVTVDAPENDPIVVSTMDLTVKYPGGVKLTDNTKTAGSGDNVTADATIGFELKEDKTGGIEVNTDTQEQTSYELTLNVSTNNETLVEVSKFIGMNLEIEAVYHKVNESTINQLFLKDSDGYVVDDEYYEYNPGTGYITLHVYHASPIDIVTKKALAVAEIGNEKFPTLQAAIVAATDGDTISLIDDIDLTGSDGSEQIIFLKNLTLDLNGHTIKGSIWSGDYSSNADGTRLTLKDSKSGGQIYSKFRLLDSGAMMQANAVTTWQHAVTINSGKYVSNNVAVVCQVQNTNVAEGVIINGGYFGGTDDLIEGVDDLPGPVGGCVEAVIGTVTINGGTFEAAKYGSVIIAESGSSRVETVVNINGGTFKGACMFDFGADHSSKTIVNVYGGNFEVKNPDDSTVISASSFAYDNYTHAALVNNGMFELNIMGGTFNYDPSAYVDTANYNVTNNGSTWTVTAK